MHKTTALLRSIFTPVRTSNQGKNTFPDSATSPACYSKHLVIEGLQVIAATHAEEGGWLLALDQPTQFIILMSNKLQSKCQTHPHLIALWNLPNRRAGPLIHLLLSLPSGLHFWELGLTCHYSNKEMTTFCLYLFTSYPFKEIYLDCMRLNASTACSRDIQERVNQLPASALVLFVRD